MLKELKNLNIENCSKEQLMAIVRQTLPIIVLHTQITQELINRYNNSNTLQANQIDSKNDISDKTDEKWCTVAKAAKKLGRARTIIHRWVDEDGSIIQTNGMAGRDRRIYFPDVLYKKFKAEQRDLKKDFDEYLSDVRKVSNEH